MRKIYSLVLMAMMLLVGTNAWAQQNVAKIGNVEYATFKAALGAAQNGDQIIVIAAATMNDTYDLVDGRNITVNLNGNNITGTSLRINIYHGTLSFIGAGTVTSGGNAVVRLLGTTDPAAVNWSVLNVGEKVNLINEDDHYGVFVSFFGTDDPYYNNPLDYYTYNYRTDNTTNKKKTAAYGVVINVDGFVSGYYGGLYVNGTINETTGNVPTVNVSSTGTIVSTGNEGAGIYAAGYTVWNISGTVTGDNGIYCKGGAINLDGATITATGEYKAPDPNGNGFDASGSALVFDSYQGYSDNLSLNVTGDTKVTSENGYAIEEVVTLMDDSKTKMDAEDFVIESGTFTSAPGHEAVTVTNDLSADIKAEGTVTGGMFSSPVDDIFVSDATTNGTTIDVVIEGVTYQVVVPDEQTPTNYYEREGASAITYGTICLPKDGVIYGADLYVPEYKTADMLYFVEAGNAIVGGKAYVFKRTGSHVIVNYAKNATAKALVTDEAMVGAYEQAQIAQNNNFCIIKDNAYYHVNSANVYVGENRAYIDLSKVPTTSTTTNPSPRRIVFHDASTETTTGMENVETVNGVQKVMIDGQMYILRGEHMFNAAGQMVK